MSDIRTVLVVDLSHMFWTTALGMRAALQARDVVIRDIKALERHYDRIVIMCDPKGPSWRAVLCPEYKGDRTRQGFTPERYAALDSTIDHCQSRGWHVFTMPEHPKYPGHFYEADDGIKTIVAWIAGNTEASTDILTGDSDLAMLTDDETCVRFCRRYNGHTAYMNAEAVEEWIGVPPARILEVKALAGDNDNYKPFPGIGKGTAVKLLKAAPEQTARSVITAALAAGITKNKDGKTESQNSRILNEGGHARVDFGYAMAALCPDVPIDCASILEKREAVAHRDIVEDLLPESPAEPEPEPEPPTVEGEKVESPPTTALATRPVQFGALITADAARAEMERLQRLIRACMKPGVDFAQYPGMPKPFLHKPGAEKLADFYGFTPRYECVSAVEKWDTDPPFFYYRYRCILSRRSDGSHVGEKLGSCNSREKKYAGTWEWESRVPAHIDIDRLRYREFPIKKGPDKGKLTRQYYVPNEDICSLVHTFDAMAQKRAYVLAVREATRTGGIFDVDEDIRGDNGGDNDR